MTVPGTFASAAQEGLRIAMENPSSILLLLLVILLAAGTMETIRSYSRLRHVPGPWIAGWTKMMLVRLVCSGDGHLRLQALCDQYGPIARISPNVVVTKDVSLLRRMAGARSKYVRNTWYAAFRFNPERDTVLSHRDEVEHMRLRGMMAKGYAGKEIASLEEKVNSNIMNLVLLLQTKYLSTPTETIPVDIAEKAQFFTMDTIGEVAFGEALGFVTNDKDMHDYLRTSKESFPFMVFISNFPTLGLMVLDVFKHFLPSAKDRLGLGSLMKYAQELASERFRDEKENIHQDMLGSFIRHGLTKEEAQSESVLQLLAGGETTATALRVILFYVFTNPRVLTSLRAELATAHPSSPITDAEARKLPYLQAVIKEGLRICPPITGLLLKDVPAGGETASGYFLPQGTAIGWTVMGIMRDVASWGEDAAYFRPERFLEGSDDEMKERAALVDGVFGFGKWGCLGRNIALIELNKVIPEIVRTFDLTVLNPLEPFKTWNAGIHLQSDMWMRVTPAP